MRFGPLNIILDLPAYRYSWWRYFGEHWQSDSITLYGFISLLDQWASGYEAYDRLSPAYQTFLEGLTATHDGTMFDEVDF